MLPAGGVETNVIRAKLCDCCGYVHPGEDSDVDLCVHCGTRLDGASSQYPQALFRHGSGATLNANRFRGGGARPRKAISPPRISVVRAVVRTRKAFSETRRQKMRSFRPNICRRRSSGGSNRGWRKSAEQAVFILDGATGRWRSKEQNGGHAPNVMTGIRPFVAKHPVAAADDRARERPGIPEESCVCAPPCLTDRISGGRTGVLRQCRQHRAAGLHRGRAGRQRGQSDRCYVPVGRVAGAGLGGLRQCRGHARPARLGGPLRLARGRAAARAFHAGFDQADADSASTDQTGKSGAL
jgi:hypothetical protein